MGPTMPADFKFSPKVWADHVSAYFPQKLGFSKFAWQPEEMNLTAKPGTQIEFPYFKNIGSAQKPTPSENLIVDKLEDDSFSATVAEIAKAVSARKAAFYESAASQERISKEVQMQMARVIAEQVEADIITEINTTGNYEQGYVSLDANDRASVEKILEGNIVAFGDKANEVVGYIMHSFVYLDMAISTSSGFMKADANDPWFNVPGFMGRILGKPVFVDDSCPSASAIGGKKTYEMFSFKDKAFGFLLKQEPEIEMDKDILARELVWALTQWSAVKALHKKTSPNDKRIARLTFATKQAAS